MNRLVKYKNILNRKSIGNFLSSGFIQTYPRYINKKSLCVSISVISASIFGYNIFKHNVVQTNCSIFYSKKSVIHEWTNAPEHVKTGEERVEDDLDLNKDVPFPSDNETIPSEHPVSQVEFSQDSDLSSTLPTEIPYVIIGGGVAGMSAARAIRASDPFAKVLIIDCECQSPGNHNESYPPYRRFLLSKYIWRRSEEYQESLMDTTGDVKKSSFLFIEPQTFFIEPNKLDQCEYGGIALLSGCKVVGISPEEFSITLDQLNYKIHYKACLIATGSHPKRLKHLEKADNTGVDLFEMGKVSYFRSINDFRNLSEKVKQFKNNGQTGKFMVIGSGLLGTELTSSLGRVGRDRGHLEVVEVFREKSHLHYILPDQLSHYIYRNVRRNNTKLISNSEVVAISEVIDGPDKGRLSVSIKPLASDSDDLSPRKELVDHIVIAAGVEPETSLSGSGRLELDENNGGYLVNAELQARQGLFVAGDACSFYDPLLGRRRVEHWNHSEESGNVAGHNMAAYVLSTNLHSNRKSSIDTSNLATDIFKPRIYDFQSSFSFKMNTFMSFEGLGRISSDLDTEIFVAKEFFDQHLSENEGESNTTETVNPTAVEPAGPRDPLDMPAVVFYLNNRRIVGILLWNCDDDLMIDTDFPSPLRTNLARKILAEQHLITSDNELKKLAANFDLSFFVNSELKLIDEYSKKRQQQQLGSDDDLNVMNKS